MKLFIERIICSMLILICCLSAYAGNIFKLNNSQCIKTKMNQEVLDIYLGNCKSINQKIDSVEVPNDYPNVEYVSTNILDSKHNFYIALSYNENYRDVYNKYNYANKFYIINAYTCDFKGNCNKNEKLSSFFGNGGDIQDLNTNKIVYKYPYSKKSELETELNSKLFKNWLAGKLTYGTVLKKTFINDVSNFTPNHKSYLIKGDKFIIQNISSKWLNINYTNKNGRTTTGWIACDDTDVCH